ETLYANQARMQTHYPVSIATHGMALNITVQSYRYQLFIGITACAESVPDLDALRDDILKAYRDLNQRLLPNISEFKPKYVAPRTSPHQEIPQNKVA
ncbi:MAG: diacylglycerol O-acyltransferase, partial [Candidatus Azotimanducaceae bacterium]